jgi:hypothetical protein
MSHRWNKCVEHYDHGVYEFFADHFSEVHRQVLIVGGAGFDPRATACVLKLSEILTNRLKCVFIKEERPEPDLKLVQKAAENLESLCSIYPSSKVITIDVFSDDNAVVGGINVISSLATVSLDEFTDIIIDFSALSIGISFPIVKYIYDKILNEHIKCNIHIVVLSNPNLDSMITSIPNDRATEVRGFSRRDRLYGEGEKAKLWLPQLSGGRKEVLRLIYESIAPHDTCPILPFPSADVKKGDKLAVDFIPELENEWRVDKRNYVYADENNPLDIYRTILKIDDQRGPVFESFGGSVVILSPLGSKLLAIGALMAALERQFPVVYVEALEYKVDWDKVDLLQEDASKIAHIWLYGEAYLHDF